jgi:hypothetical protein
MNSQFFLRKCQTKNKGKKFALNFKSFFKKVVDRKVLGK